VPPIPDARKTELDTVADSLRKLTAALTAVDGVKGEIARLMKTNQRHADRAKVYRESAAAEVDAIRAREAAEKELLQTYAQVETMRDQVRAAIAGLTDPIAQAGGAFSSLAQQAQLAGVLSDLAPDKPTLDLYLSTLRGLLLERKRELQGKRRVAAPGSVKPSIRKNAPAGPMSPTGGTPASVQAPGKPATFDAGKAIEHFPNVRLHEADDGPAFEAILAIAKENKSQTNWEVELQDGSHCTLATIDKRPAAYIVVQIKAGLPREMRLWASSPSIKDAGARSQALQALIANAVDEFQKSNDRELFMELGESDYDNLKYLHGKGFRVHEGFHDDDKGPDSFGHFLLFLKKKD